MKDEKAYISWGRVEGALEERRVEGGIPARRDPTTQTGAPSRPQRER